MGQMMRSERLAGYRRHAISGEGRKKVYELHPAEWQAIIDEGTFARLRSVVGFSEQCSVLPSPLDNAPLRAVTG
jgi:hypothetical protein